MRNVAAPYVKGKLGVLMLGLGGSAVLEYAAVFGDGGPLWQLIFGLVVTPMGIWVLVRSD